MKYHSITLVVETNDDDESEKNLEHYYSRIHNEFQLNQTLAKVKSMMFNTVKTPYQLRGTTCEVLCDPRMWVTVWRNKQNEVFDYHLTWISTDKSDAGLHTITFNGDQFEEFIKSLENVVRKYSNPRLCKHARSGNGCALGNSTSPSWCNGNNPAIGCYER